MFSSGVETDLRSKVYLKLYKIQQTFSDKEFFLAFTLDFQPAHPRTTGSLGKGTIPTCPQCKTTLPGRPNSQTYTAAEETCAHCWCMVGQSLSNEEQTVRKLLSTEEETAALTAENQGEASEELTLTNAGNGRTIKILYYTTTLKSQQIQ